MINIQKIFILLFFFSLSRPDFAFATESNWAFPDSVIESSSYEERDAFLYMSALKRVSNQLRFERSEKLDSAKVTSTLYRLDRSEDMSEVWRHYVEQIEKVGEVQFSCEHRACGTSTNWANRLYEIAKLTGRDDNQYYVIGQLANQKVWVSAYVVKNGRKQNYVYVQIIESLEPTSQLSPQIVDSMKLNDLDDSFWMDLKANHLLLDSEVLILQIHFPVTDGFQSAFDTSIKLESELSKTILDAFGIKKDRLHVLLSGPVDEKQLETEISVWKTSE